MYGVANAAWGPLDGRIAAGEVVSLYGPHIGPVPAVVYSPDSSGAVPKSLGGVQVLFNDLPAPLLYVSDSQINAVVPFGVANQSTVRIRIVSNGSSSRFHSHELDVDAADFSEPQRGGRRHQPGRHDQLCGPSGSAGFDRLDLGDGRIYPSVPDGEIAIAARYFGCCQVYAGGNLLRVPYSGAAPGMVAGVVQINFQVPEDAAGLTYVTVVAGNRVSNPAYIVVAPLP